MIPVSYELRLSRELDFLLCLLKNDHQSVARIELLLEHGLRWDAIGKSVFLPHIHLKLERLPEECPVPESFKEQSARSYHQTALLNDFRLRWMQEIAIDLRELGIEPLFLKGAAELIDFCDFSDYPGSRQMSDIDFACRESEFSQIHNYLLDNGNVSAYEESREDMLEFTGHYSYNPHSPKLLEMHVDTYMFQHQEQSYPADFSRELFTRKRRVHLECAECAIPSREDMLVYLICHAAGAKDYKLMCSMRGNMYDCLLGRKIPLRERIDNRLAAHQIRFLFQFDLFLEACGEEVDFEVVMSELSKVKDKALIQQHIELVHFFTKRDVFRRYLQHRSCEAFLSDRQAFLERMAQTQLLNLWLKKYLPERIVLALKIALLKVKSFLVSILGKLFKE